MSQLTLEFEVEKLVAKSRGSLRRASELVKETLPPTDPKVCTTIEEIVRFSGQNGVILERLRRGPAKNYELAALAINYRARISDLRNYGFEIKVEKVSGGTNEYRLMQGAVT